jgi:hypothetical protein
VKKFDNTPSGLVNEFTRNEQTIKTSIGEKAFTDKLKKLNELKKEEEEKGIF